MAHGSQQDFFISKKVSSNLIEVEEHFGLNSDHLAVILTRSVWIYV